MEQKQFAVIWDMDGTLVDTAEHHYVAWHNAAKRAGRGFSREDFALTFGHRNPEIITYLFGDTLPAEDEAYLAESKENEYREAIKKHGVTLLPGAKQLIESLYRRGFYQAIGTSAPRANLEQIIGQTSIGVFIQASVTGQDTSKGKPDPEVFLTAAQLLSVQPAQCVVFEDAEAGVKAAKAAGMHCVAVCTGGHSSPGELRAAGADVVLANLTKIDVDGIAAILGGKGRHSHD